MSLDHAKLYLFRAVPWIDGAYVNIHWSTRKTNPHNGKPYFNGVPCSTLNEAVNAVQRAMTNPDAREIYVCMSAQTMVADRQTGNGRSFKAAVRSQENVAALRSLFVDIDVKEGGYATTQAALLDLKRFLVESGMPKPTMAVASGSGGIHAYWCMSRPVTLEEWQPLANALVEAARRHDFRIDTQCSVDSARVLRVPGTLNRKTEPARPVTLGINSIQPGDYDVETLRTALAPYQGATVIPLTPRGKAADVNDELSAGIEAPKARPVDLDSIASTCGFVHEALTTGGAAFDQPLWNIATLLASFTMSVDPSGAPGATFDGRAGAHRMAAGHPEYKPEDTDSLYDRKLREREDKNLGWPSCHSVQNAGCGNCATCPMLGLGKSPLAFGRAFADPALGSLGMSGMQGLAQIAQIGGSPVQPGAPGAPAPAGVPQVNDMPNGYYRNGDGRVFALIPQADGTTQQREIIPYILVGGWLQDHPWTLHFVTRLGNTQHQTQISISLDQLMSREFTKHLGRQGLVVNRHQSGFLQEFLVAWITKLQQMKDAVVSASPYGWSVVNGRIDGFCYGGRLWQPGGDKPAASADPVLEYQYKPRGDLQPWRDACDYLLAQGRPALDTIIATSFGAPLMRFTGEAGVIISTYSTESGIGKSTTLKVAQAVWGDPKKGMQSLSDTANSVLNKLGELRSLPLFWDELKGEEQTSRFVSLAFQLSGGKEKSRMRSDGSLRDPGSWQTILLAASNDSLVDPIVRHTKTTTAGLYRVFEYPVPPALANTDGHGVVARLVGRCDDNFGHAGLAYAQFLGANHERIAKEVAELQDKLSTRLKAQPDERYWFAAITCVLMGARYAMEAGLAKFDQAKLLQFLAGVLARQRQERDTQSVDMRSTSALSNVLQQYLAAQQAKHTIITDRVHVGQGRPAVGSVKIVSDVSRLDGVYVQIGLDNKLLRIAETHFKDWLAHRNYSPHLVIKSIEDSFGVKRIHGYLGAGTNLSGGLKQYLLEISLAGTQLAGMNEFGSETQGAA